MVRRIALVLALFGIVVLVSACKKPKPGDACVTDGRQLCIDKKNSIVCVDKKWEALPCRGTTGCIAAGTNVDCDNDGYNDGEYCDPATDKFECSADKKYEVKCTGKHWALSDKCLGSKGCTSTATEVKCDDSVSEVGAPCEHNEAYSCTMDGKQILKCSAHKMVLDQFCRGAHGCKKIPGDKLSCDDSIGLPNDPCDADEEREKEKACSVDRSQLLVCKGEKMVPFKTCKGGCALTGNGESFECK